jgi:peptidoglycan hydrolase-like protein with peptidoglycan-binding domain
MTAIIRTVVVSLGITAGAALSGAQAHEHPASPGQPAARTQARGQSTGLGLTRDRVLQLQAALNAAGCDVGQPDGAVGPRTRRALACARQKHGVPASDMGALYAALGLSFTADRPGAGGVMSDGGAGDAAIRHERMMDHVYGKDRERRPPGAEGKRSPAIKPERRDTTPR